MECKWIKWKVVWLIHRSEIAMHHSIPYALKKHRKTPQTNWNVWKCVSIALSFIADSSHASHKTQNSICKMELAGTLRKYKQYHRWLAGWLGGSVPPTNKFVCMQIIANIWKIHSQIANELPEHCCEAIANAINSRTMTKANKIQSSKCAGSVMSCTQTVIQIVCVWMCACARLFFVMPKHRLPLARVFLLFN